MWGPYQPTPGILGLAPRPWTLLASDGARLVCQGKIQPEHPESRPLVPTWISASLGVNLSVSLSFTHVLATMAFIIW